MTIAMFGSLIGGIGLFLLGMRLMTDGLKYAAGNSLRSILESSTSTPLRGVLSGAFITALVQSSGAVTVAAIGFVNAGLMEFGHAVSIIYGTNIGTTMTAWLVSLVGFKLKIKAFAVPAVGIGMFMRLVKHDSKRGAFGDVLAGFGVFFMGIGVLKNCFSGVGESLMISSMAGSGFSALVIFVGLGFLLTFLIQSSSASIAIIMTALAGNVLPLNDAAAMVIGANVGATSTAVLAVMGTCSDAKRLAAAHVVFNLITGLVALLILPVMLDLVTEMEKVLGLAKTPATKLALFHTGFNVLGVLLFLPATGPLIRFLARRWRTQEEDESVPRYLNKNVTSTPVMAIQSIAMELQRVGGFARRMAKGAISSEKGPSQRLQQDKAIIDKLILAVDEFSNYLQRANLPADLDNHLPNCLRVSGYYWAVAELAVDIAIMQQEDYRLGDHPELAEAVAHFKKDTVMLVAQADTELDDFDPKQCREKVADLKQEYKKLKLKLLRAASRSGLHVNKMVHILELLARIRRIAEQVEKGARYLTEVRSYGGMAETFKTFSKP